jgi:hypothetical protein
MEVRQFSIFAVYFDDALEPVVGGCVWLSEGIVTVCLTDSPTGPPPRESSGFRKPYASRKDSTADDAEATPRREFADLLYTSQTTVCDGTDPHRNQEALLRVRWCV